MAGTLHPHDHAPRQEQTAPLVAEVAVRTAPPAAGTGVRLRRSGSGSRGCRTRRVLQRARTVCQRTAPARFAGTARRACPVVVLHGTTAGVNERHGPPATMVRMAVCRAPVPVASWGKAVHMGSTYCQHLNQIIRLAPPDDAPENARYLRYVVLWLRATERTADLQRQLERLHAEIAAEVRAGSPHALVAASDLAERLALAAIDVAQLLVLADSVYQRLMACVA